MKVALLSRITLVLAVGSLALCGCSHQYVMRLSNGRSITTASKPKLKGGYYHFKDALGRDNVMSQGRVLEIEPASMAKDERPMFKPGLK